MKDAIAGKVLHIRKQPEKAAAVTIIIIHRITAVNTTRKKIQEKKRKSRA